MGMQTHTLSSLMVIYIVKFFIIMIFNTIMMFLSGHFVLCVHLLLNNALPDSLDFLF